MVTETKTEQPDPKWQISASSCYRTGGSVPVPSQAKEKIKRRIKLHRYKEETVDDFSQEFAAKLPDFSNDDSFDSLTQITEVSNFCDQKWVGVTQDVRTCSPPPPPEPPKKQQQCKKHTRCHCDLLSLDSSLLTKPKLSSTHLLIVNTQT